MDETNMVTINTPGQTESYVNPWPDGHVKYIAGFFTDEGGPYGWVLMVSNFYEMEKLTGKLIKEQIDFFKVHPTSRFFGFKTEKEAAFYSLIVSRKNESMI